MLSGSYLRREDRWGNGHDQNKLMQKTFPNQVLFCQTGLFDYQVRNLWELDAVGISGSEDHQPDKVLTRFNKDIAALLVARLMNFVNRALGLQNNLPYTCWSHSQIVLNWIRSDATQWKQFVRNRVQEIQELTSPDKWRFCPGKENPVDLVARSVKAQELIQSVVWLHGPYWLKITVPVLNNQLQRKQKNCEKKRTMKTKRKFL